MDSTDEEFYGSTSFTTKGRRTKRQRTTTTTTAATATATTSDTENYIETSYGSSTSATPSPSSTPDENDVVSGLTTEEEETANCLILLSHGGNNRRRRRSAAVAAIGGSGGVYECKTCNRTFPSFQALGGHRTSHKKIVKPPKFDEKVNEIVNPVIPPRKITTGGNRSSDLAAVAVAAAEVAVTVVRAHVCGICGSEFPSGQALGGHMRRHRPAVVIPVVPSENHPIIIQETSSTSTSGGRNILPLDLNLPAPDDDHDQVIVVDSSHMVDNTKFHVLPTPALLDCHY